jgi:hypothetical protein
MAGLLIGTVTFFFPDTRGSTRPLRKLKNAYTEQEG